jgi:hypothetical protein
MAAGGTGGAIDLLIAAQKRWSGYRLPSPGRQAVRAGDRSRFAIAPKTGGEAFHRAGLLLRLDLLDLRQWSV